MLREFRYVDELSIIITQNNLALALELPGKNKQAQTIRSELSSRDASVALHAISAHKRPGVAEQSA
jgi:hypothetical protein